MAATLHLENHPALQRSYVRYGYIRAKDVALIVYHADMETKWNLQQEAKKHFKAHQKLGAKAEKEFFENQEVSAKPCFQSPAQRLFWHHAQAHFAANVDPDLVYSSRTAVNPRPLLQTITAQQAMPDTADTFEAFEPTAIGEDGAEQTLADLALVPVPHESLASPPRIQPEDFLHFRVIQARPNAIAMVKLGAGVAGRFAAGDMTIAIQPVKADDAGSLHMTDTFLSSDPVDVTQLIHTWNPYAGQSIDAFSDSLLAWRPGALTLSSVDLSGFEGVDALKLHEAVSQLVKASAFGEGSGEDGDAVAQPLILKGGLELPTQGCDQLLASLQLLSERGP